MIYKILFFSIIVLLACSTSSKMNGTQKSWITISKKTTCKNLTGSASKYDMGITYFFFPKTIEINGKIYNEVKLDNTLNKDRFSGYIRASRDTVYWLDSKWNLNNDRRISNEQIFLLFEDNPQENKKWDFNSSSSLLDSYNISLSQVRQVAVDDKEYTFDFNYKGVHGSDYVILKNIVVSIKNGFKRLSIETSNGDSSTCNFINF